MPNTTGTERFIAIIGGEQKLPPIAPPQPETKAQAPSQDPYFDEELDAWESLPTLEDIRALNKKYEEEARASRAKLRVGSTNGTQPHYTAGSAYQPTDADLQLDSRLGELAPKGLCFTPFVAITKFCYKFVDKKWMQPLATAFFDADKIYERDWDLYYIWSGHYETAKPITFVPEHQLLTLITNINEAFPEAKIGISDELRAEGLVLDFDDLSSELRPVWLGHCKSREQYNSWTNSVPLPSRSDKMPDGRSLEAFKDMIHRASELNKTKNKAKKAVRQETAVRTRQEMKGQVKRVQQYLGLLPKVDGATDGTTDEAISLPAIEDLSLSPLDAEKPAPAPFELDAIFIAIDAEAFEEFPKVVTEVGVATLDTRDLKNEPPGPRGENWQKHVRARHFRVIEYKHLRNHKYVEGCPESFEFGQSEFIGKENLASVLTSCFHQPFSKDLESATGDSAANTGEEKRNLILLGHDTFQDVNYLQSIGFAVLNRGNILEVMDTAAMFRAYTRDVNPTALGKILYHFDMTGWHLHNAGNDAIYTVWAMLAITVQAATERGTEAEEQRHEQTLAKRTETAIENAKEKVKDESEGWVDESGKNNESEEAKKPAYGPPRPPEHRFYTMGGAPLDV